MNVLVRLTMAVCVLVGSANAFAQTREAEHAAHHPAGSVSVATSSPSESTQTESIMMRQMQDSMKTMQQQMAAINATKDPSKRKALLAQHMHAMHEHMGMMRSMMKTTMMANKGDGTKAVGMMNCGKMMNGDNDMMQMMMNQMQQHMNAVDATETPK